MKNLGFLMNSEEQGWGASNSFGIRALNEMGGMIEFGWGGLIKINEFN